MMPFAQAADRTIGASYTLVADEDWTDESVDIASGATVNLNGHSLRIGSVGVTGEGAAPVFTGTSGELCISVPEGESFANPGWSVAGEVSVVKDGAGLFSWNGGTIAASAPISVTGGVFKVGVTTANVFGESGTVTVAGTGQFDVNFNAGNNDDASSPVSPRTFYIEGDGPDGSGAVVNNIASSGFGQHLWNVVLTGDATIGGWSMIEFRRSGHGVDGANHTLTIKNTERFLIDKSAYVRNCADIVIDGGKFQYCNRCELGVSGEIVLANGGELISFVNQKVNNDYTQAINVPITVRGGAGTLSSGNRWYDVFAPITVESGCTLNCVSDGPWYDGAITNKANATLNISGEFNARSVFVNNGFVNHTADDFRLGGRNESNHPCAVENNGTIRTSGNIFQFKAESSMTGTGTLDLAGGSPSVAGDLSGFTGMVRVSGGTASLSSIATLGGTLVLAGGTVSTSLSDVTCPVVFDLSEKTAPFTIPDSWLTLPANKQVTIGLRGRTIAWGEKLLSWETAPSLSFSLAEGSTPLVEKADGLYFGDGDIVPVSATWTGAAGNGLFADVANWTCLDGNGDPVTAFPAASTTITLDADVPQGGWATFDLAQQTGAIDVNGYRLVLQPPSGNSPALTIIDSSGDTSHPGELHFTIGEGVAYTNTASFGILGNLSLVKDGPGLFVWGGGTLDATIPIAVTGGVFRVGVTTADVFGSSGTITVAGTGQFDINYGPWANHRSSPVRNRTFYIEGEGPDGTGAIVNNVVNGDYGNHLNNVVMTGDATIGGISRIDFRGSKNYGIDGKGHELTIKNTGMIALAASSTFIKNCSDIIIDGGVLQPCNPCVLGVSGHIILENGGAFATWDTQTFDVPVIVGEGGGVIRSDNNKSFQMNGEVEVFDGSVLTVGACTVTMSDLTNNPGATIVFSDASANLSVTGEFANNGVVRMTGGTFAPVATGTGVFELVGGSPSLAGDLSGFTGTILLSGGTASIPSVNTFPGTLRLRDGAVSSSLAGFPGTAVIDLKGRDLPYDIEGKGWTEFSAGKVVLVDVGERKFKSGDQILTWTTPPSSRLRFKLANGQHGSLYMTESGVFYGCGLMLILR